MALTPMMRQYQEIKETEPDALLMFRLGDFYELFFDDAVLASKELDITLTGRDAGEAGRIPMCGVPHHAVEQYLERLTDKGYRVAICEQVEDPKAAKGLVAREIVRVVTPGTALSLESSNRFLAAVVQLKDQFGLSFADVSTGELFMGEADDTHCQEQLQLWKPIELIVQKGWAMPSWLTQFVDEAGVLVTVRAEAKDTVIASQYGVMSPGTVGLVPGTASTQAVANILSYVEDTQKGSLRHLQEPRRIFEQTHLSVGATAMRHLELTATARDGGRRGSLISILDQTMTAAGSRLLRSWLERPLCDKSAILARQEAVAAFVDDFILREEVRDALKGVHDLARLVARCAFHNASARDLLQLARSLANGHMVMDTLASNQTSHLLSYLVEQSPNLLTFAEMLEGQLVDEPPTQVKEGGLFKSGVDAKLDKLRDLQTGGRSWLRELEQRERDKTGIKSLKVGYNKVFGYYIEVSKSNIQHVPNSYERRQTLASAERFVLPELKAREADILSAEERAMAHEYALFQALCEQVLELGPKIQAFADVIAQIDVLQSLAKVANDRHYVCPTVVDDVGIDIVKGRHPVVESLTGRLFVPNDTVLQPDAHIILLTGPNMGGKSTYMRQTALIVILTQMGSFVPAAQATIGIVDQIFARIGAADDLGRGQSTFMVEMIELAEILRQSTSRSLVLLDEIGRGTSTYDGLSIAESVVEELTTRAAKPLTMFATHYHELIGFSDRFPSVRNHSMAVEETRDGITFLHAVVNSPSDRSYGIQVARLAGLPSHVVNRAEALLNLRESSMPEQCEVAATKDGDASIQAQRMPESMRTSRRGQNAPDLNLFSGPYRELVESLSEEDLIQMTPLEAMNRLNEWIEKAKEVKAWDESK